MVQVLHSEHMLPLIMKHGVLKKKLALVHRMLMVEAVNRTMGGIAQELHNEVLAYILQVPCPWHLPSSVHTCAHYSIGWSVHYSIGESVNTVTHRFSILRYTCLCIPKLVSLHTACYAV